MLTRTPSSKLFLKFDVPGIPMAKQRVKVNTITRTAYTPERTVTYEGSFAYAAAEAMGDRLPTKAAVAMQMEVRLPIPKSWSQRKQRDARAGLLRPAKKPDWDNFGKITDALNFIVWDDDCQVVDGRVIKMYSVVPGVTLEVYCLNEERSEP